MPIYMSQINSLVSTLWQEVLSTDDNDADTDADADAKNNDDNTAQLISSVGHWPNQPKTQGKETRHLPNLICKYQYYCKLLCLII